MCDLINKNFQNDAITMMKRWLENRNNGKTFIEYLHEYACNKVIIVDAGEIGRILYDELKGSEVKVVGFYDRNAEGLQRIDDIPVYSFNDIHQIPDVDMVIVSPVYNYDSIVRLLIQVSPKIRSIYMRDAVYEF